MKTTMKKTAAYLLAILLVFQMIPAFAEDWIPSNVQGPIDDYREKLDIKAVTETLAVGMDIQLETTAGYDKLQWVSDDETIATVEGGKVHPISAGTVKITASEDGYTDTITLRVVGTEESKPAEQPEAGTGTTPQEENNTPSEKMIIIINGSKDKISYDGQEHKTTYTATSNNAGFLESKLHLKDESKLAAGKDCGVYQDSLSASDFIYDEGEYEIVLTNGWLQIKPVTATIIVDDKEMVEGGQAPELTATITGLASEEDASKISYKLEISGNKIVAKFDAVQGNYKIKSVDGDLTLKQMNDYPLYNLAVINNTWYRLGKTTIKTVKTLDEYLKGLKDNNTKAVNADEYEASLYNFDDLEIEVNRKKYVYNCAKNAEAILLGADYYTATLKNVEAAKNKIGGSGGWLIPQDQRYEDDNKTDSIHMNYTITLHEADVKAEVQDIYYMLSVDGSQDYYKLAKGSITAKPYDKVTVIDQRLKQVKESDYILDPYDFTNTVITIDGVDYKYNDGSLNEYENYFTVAFDMVVKSERFNSNAKWFNNTASWLDGAYEEYGNLPNNTKAFHANYNATTHKALPRERSVTISSDWEGKIAYPGAEITMTAELHGYSDNRVLQWQYSSNKQDWINIPNANGIRYTFTLTETTANYYWRVVVNDAE